MKLKLIEKRKETEEVTTFVWQPESAISWQAGQYLHYVLPHKNMDDRGMERWFTVSSAPFENHIQITTRFAPRSSSFKSALRELPVGSEIEGDNLEGDFTVTDPSQEFVFIAGGIGITPFRSILLDLDHRDLPMNIKLLYGNHDENFVFKNELEMLKAKHPTFSVEYFVHPKRIDAAAIKESVPVLSRPIFYISGPAPMVVAFEKILLDMGVPKEHIKLDDFPGYE